MRRLLKGLILLSAAGVKIGEDKPVAAQRHARRAAEQFRRLTTDPALEGALGMSARELAENAEAPITTFAATRATGVGEAEPVFDFILGCAPGSDESYTGRAAVEVGR